MGDALILNRLCDMGLLNNADWAIEGKLEAFWLRSRYEKARSKRMRQHIRLADFWYSTNGQLTISRRSDRI